MVTGGGGVIIMEAMRPTLINLEQVDIVEKMLAGLDEDAITTKRVLHLVDQDTTEPLLNDGGSQMTISIGWDSSYVFEALATVIDTFLLSERVHLVCPIESGNAIIPEYSTLIPQSTDFLEAVINSPEQDSGALDLSLLEWLDDDENESGLMFGRAYNGQYGDVALRLGPGDFKAMQKDINAFNAETGDVERFDQSGVLSSNLLFEAYDRLSDEYKVRVGGLFKNQADVVLPPLTTTLLARLPDGRGSGALLRHLMEMREELAPLRRRFVEFQQIDDDASKSIADAEKVMNAVKADAEHFVTKWNQDVTDNTLVQFCIDNLSFLVKLILKTRDVDPIEVAEKVAQVSPRLERRIRSSAPTILSKYALKTRRIEDITRLVEKKLALKFEAEQ